MKDNYGRKIEYMRISVTDRCNLRCVYCMPEDGVEPVCHSSILTYEEIEKVCTLFAKHGLKKIKITGGEPLVRKGVANLVYCLKKIPGIENVTLTTNGALLEKYYDDLVEAGIDAITVSLDTLDATVFKEITRCDQLDAVIRGIEKVIQDERVRLKINCVPVKSIEEQGIIRLLEFAKYKDADVRFIEMMPMGMGKQFDFVSEQELRETIENQYGKMTPYCERRGNGPARYYDVPTLKGKVGFISAITHKFCDECNRVRLTSEGYLKTCLQYDQGVDLKALLRAGASDDEIWCAMEEAIRLKPQGHHFEKKDGMCHDEQRGMSEIGG